jgi:hypothetical protein
MEETFNTAFYATVAQVIPLVIALIFFESRFRPLPSTGLTFVTRFMPLVVLAVGEANALHALYTREALTGVQRNVLIAALILGIGSLVLTPILAAAARFVPTDEKARDRFVIAMDFWAVVLSVVTVPVLVFGDPLKTLSWIAVALIPASILASHLLTSRSWDRAVTRVQEADYAKRFKLRKRSDDE